MVYFWFFVGYIDVDDGCSWLQLKDIGVSFGHFGHQRLQIHIKITIIFFVYYEIFYRYFLFESEGKNFWKKVENFGKCSQNKWEEEMRRINESLIASEFVNPWSRKSCFDHPAESFHKFLRGSFY